MTHYRNVLAKMEGTDVEPHESVPSVFKIAETNRVRLPSSDSQSTAFASWDTESDCSTPGSGTMPLDHIWDLCGLGDDSCVRGERVNKMPLKISY